MVNLNGIAVLLFSIVLALDGLAPLGVILGIIGLIMTIASNRSSNRNRY